MNKTYIVTGASRGIGFSISQRLSRLGHHVIGLARSTSTEKFPGELISIDLAQNKDDEILHRIAADNQIDGLVNNVGVAIPAEFNAIRFSDFSQAMNLNLFAAIRICQIFAPRMQEKEKGRIVNIASRAVLGLSGNSMYAASKAGLVGFARSLALELAEYGITVNTVAPGPIETEMYRKHRPEGSSLANERLMKIPLKRIGKPEEVAAVVEFLLSDDAGFITGQTIFVDGGMSIG
ncbi:MAG: SDR family oxidoreductase [Myxococcales bacterium]|nr:SDR family oxidoreductase [Myxococcales bacterium]USN51243.1 MAG: SDR family oxidoreductase [Myxococcales bacterium]